MFDFGISIRIGIEHLTFPGIGIGIEIDQMYRVTQQNDSYPLNRLWASLVIWDIDSMILMYNRHLFQKTEFANDLYSLCKGGV